MRCARCGNENPETNRFCGMCGATLLQAPPALVPSTTPSAPLPFIAPPEPVRSLELAPPFTHPAAPVSDQSPVISGPSFLGLNEPAPAPRRKGSLSIDPHSAPSAGNLDYLLEDEEERKRGGAGKFILIAMALLLAVGLGYLRWRNQGFGWMSSGTSKSSVAAQPSDAPDAGASVTPGVSPPAGDKTAPAAVSASANPPSPPADAAASSVPATKPDAPSATPDTAAAKDAVDTDGVQVTTGGRPVSTPATSETADSAPAPRASEKTADKAAVPVRAKPSAAIKPAKATDPVAEAQKFIYGKGATQDCDRGLRLLKPAADQANPKAMVEMGALYSAGLCTPRDLPTAYRWFALALRKEPDNAAVQTDLQKLWGEMTQPERQLAIKLSQ